MNFLKKIYIKPIEISLLAALKYFKAVENPVCRVSFYVRYDLRLSKAKDILLNDFWGLYRLSPSFLSLLSSVQQHTQIIGDAIIPMAQLPKLGSFGHLCIIQKER